MRPLAQRREQLAGAGQRTPLGQQLLEDRAVPRLEFLDLVGRELATHLPGNRPCEEPAAHPDPAVDAPTVDRHPLLRQRPLPREHVGVHGVDESPVEVEDQRPLHRAPSVLLGPTRPAGFEPATRGLEVRCSVP